MARRHRAGRDLFFPPGGFPEAPDAVRVEKREREDREGRFDGHDLQ